MTAPNFTHSGSYELPVARGGPSAPAPVEGAASASLPESLLLKNVLWFCRLRWMVVAALTAFGISGFFPGVFLGLGLRPQVAWPAATAAVLALANLGFLAHARLLAGPSAPPRASANLWAQIVFDLLILTVVVHYLGSLETYAAFAYLFHIVLACIFFSRSRSFAVLALASSFYVACVALEGAGLLPPATVYAGAALRAQIERTFGLSSLSVAWAIGTWVVVWYLASQLSSLVRVRDRELAKTNRRLVAAQQEKMRHMLRTTHELKAPFAAIHANAQLLLRGNCGVLTDEALDVVRRIARRCQRLATEIQRMLQLANLRSASEEPLPREEVDLVDTIQWCMDQVRQSAETRNVRIEAELRSARTIGVEDHLKMLFSNLLSNAVAYSHKDGQVQVRCAPGGGGRSLVTIEDHGIGILPEKLPHIFEEYYRTDKAAQHNRESTGLGLSIVRHVAETHGIRVRVESTPDAGTRFTLGFPGAQTPAAVPAAREEVKDGIPAIS